MDSLPDRLVKARNAAGLSQREAADKAGVSRGTINALENGRVDNVGLATLYALAGAYGTRVEVLIASHGGDRTSAAAAVSETDRAPAPSPVTR